MRASGTCAALVVIGAVLLTGCGGSRSESAQVRRLTASWLAAIAAADGSKACALITPAAKQEVMRSARVLRKQLGRTEPVTCTEYLTNIYDSVARHAALERITEVTLASNGDAAMAHIRVAHESATEIPLAKTPAGWRVDRFWPPLGEPHSPRSPIQG
jgi:hypothetical protein